MRKIIKNLKNKNIEIITKNNEIYEKYSKVNKELDEEVQRLKENLIQNKEYFNYEKNKIKMREEIDEINKIMN